MVGPAHLRALELGGYKRGSRSKIRRRRIRRRRRIGGGGGGGGGGAGGRLSKKKSQETQKYQYANRKPVCF
jgi:hypothetical protein